MLLAILKDEPYDAFILDLLEGADTGDRSCLARAVELAAEVYTADAMWMRVSAGIPIHLIR